MKVGVLTSDFWLLDFDLGLPSGRLKLVKLESSSAKVRFPIPMIATADSIRCRKLFDNTRG